VPRNRQAVDRSEKIDEIVSVGAKAVLAGGYEGLSFTGIADDLGLARGAVYWYFPSKDDLLVAIADRVYADALSNPPVSDDFVERIGWAVNQLQGLEPVTTAMRDRARHSAAVADLEVSIQGEMCTRLRAVLKGQVADEVLGPTADAVVVFVTGLLAMPLPMDEKHERLRFVLARLVEQGRLTSGSGAGGPRSGP
jgi:AcrR family transcriptional regulator